MTLGNSVVEDFFGFFFFFNFAVDCFTVHLNYERRYSGSFGQWKFISCLDGK